MDPVYAIGELKSIRCAFFKFNENGIWVIPLEPAEFTGTQYKIKGKSIILQSIYPIQSIPKNLEFINIQYSEFQKIQPYILDLFFPVIKFPGITCDQENWIDQNKNYCAFHCVLHVFLRSDMCKTLCFTQIPSLSAYKTLLNKLKDATIKTNSDDIIALLKVLEQKNFFICKESSPDTFPMDPILFAMIFLEALKIPYFSYNNDYIKNYINYKNYGIFPKLIESERYGTLDNTNIAIIQVETYNGKYDISQQIKSELHDFILDGAFLSNKTHSIAGITCLKTKYIINYGKSYYYDWTTPYILNKEEPFIPVFFIYVRIEKGGCFDLKQKRRILIKHKSDNQS